ncbi:phasin family protein [Verticiella sediminum]|uniref:Phasin family protein n=1 Tax=Verticiella sediminum TaxID=1247510 RepID=A0A556AIV1_9BURK|nr:phasin family protein [Verticiella sediminum]TSH92807.1 phasin family protein [Verticiella sediminum]
MPDPDDDSPLALYKAHLKFHTSVNRLYQEGARRWLGFCHQLVADGIAESDAEVEALLHTENWQKLSTLPAEAFWRQVQQRFDDARAAARIAITAQTAFAAGLQDAAQAWQRETVDALGRLAAAHPLGTAWRGLIERREPPGPVRAAAPVPARATQGE